MRIPALDNLIVPKELIAQRPVFPRSSAKLLVYNRADRSIVDTTFDKLEGYLPKNTTLVLNNTKVDKCRLIFKSDEKRVTSDDDSSGISNLTCDQDSSLLRPYGATAGKHFPERTSEQNTPSLKLRRDAVEIFVLEGVDANSAWCMVRPGKKFKSDEKRVTSDDGGIRLAEGIRCRVMAINDEGHRLIKFNVGLGSKELEPYRHIPLPPYMAQDDGLEGEYQTVFAKNGGSLAAPTASLHFDEDQLARIRAKWPVAEINLSVGLGTFANLKDENFRSQKLHSEKFEIDAEDADIINKAEHITAVGTTSLRCLEGAGIKRAENGEQETGVSGRTDIFITPGYEFKVVDSLVTNFHLPGTSLLYLVAALMGDSDELVRVYQHAMDRGYRFFSFGDAMLIL